MISVISHEMAFAAQEVSAHAGVPPAGGFIGAVKGDCEKVLMDISEKCYGAILTVSKEKLGLQSNEIVEIIDLRLQPELIKTIIDNKQ